MAERPVSLRAIVLEDSELLSILSAELGLSQPPPIGFFGVEDCMGKSPRAYVALPDSDAGALRLLRIAAPRAGVLRAKLARLRRHALQNGFVLRLEY